MTHTPDTARGASDPQAGDADTEAELRVQQEAPPSPVPLAPGDEVAAGSPGAAEAICRACGGSRMSADGSTCPICLGTGVVEVGIGGG